MVDGIAAAAARKGADRSATALLSRSESEIPPSRTLSFSVARDRATRPVLEARSRRAWRYARERASRRDKETDTPNRLLPYFRRNAIGAIARTNPPAPAHFCVAVRCRQDRYFSLTLSLSLFLSSSLPIPLATLNSQRPRWNASMFAVDSGNVLGSNSKIDGGTDAVRKIGRPFEQRSGKERMARNKSARQVVEAMGEGEMTEYKGKRFH